MIHILDGQTDEMIDALSVDEGDLFSSERVDNLKNLSTLFCIVNAKSEKAGLLKDRARLVTQDEDGNFKEYVIMDSFNDGEELEVNAYGSFLPDLSEARRIPAQKLQGKTLSEMVDLALSTQDYWEKGRVDYVGIRSSELDEDIAPYSLLLKAKTVFNDEKELRISFRIEVSGYRIVRRYVDVTIVENEFSGKEVEAGKDLLGIKRHIDESNIVTALRCLGPQKEDGSRVIVNVYDADALARWGRNGQHLWGDYEPQSADQDMTEARLMQLGKMELKKRINALVKYEGTIEDLERAGILHEKARLDDVIRIKDTSFVPPLYLEARIHEVKVNDLTKKVEEFVIGDFIEFKEEDLLAKIDTLRKLMADKASKAQLVESIELVTVQLQEYVDNAIVDFDSIIKGAFKDGIVEEAESKAIEKYLNTLNAEKQALDSQYNVLIADTSLTGTAKTNLTTAKNGYNTAQSNLIVAINSAIADGKATQAEKQDVDNKFGLYRTAYGTLATRITEARTAIEQAKANKAESNAKEHANIVADQATATAIAEAQRQVNQTRTELEQNISLKADATWVNGQLVSKADKADTYTKTEVNNKLDTKVSTTTYATDKNGIVLRLDSAETRITQTEKDISTKVSKTEYDALQSRMSTAETSITQQANQIALKANQSTVDTLTSRVSTAESQLTVQAGQIATKVTQSDVDRSIGNIQVGGRNLLRNSILPIKTHGVNRFEEVVNVSTPFGIFNVGKYTTTNDNTFSSLIRYDKAFNEINIPYTFSIFVKCVDAGTTATVQIDIADGLAKSFAVTDEWRRISVTDIPKKTDSVYRFVDVGIRTKDVPVYIAFWQLEKGNIATSWQEAPEDTQAKLDAQAQRITTAETSITQNSQQIALKANQSTVDTLTGRVSTAESNITAQAGQISLKASKSDVDSLTGRVSTAESNINAQAGQIDLMVKKDGVIGSINLTPETALINFAKVKMTGELEARHIKSLNGLNINDQFVVSASGDVSLNNGKGVWDKTGITVTDGDFRLKDSSSGMTYSIVNKQNLILDHSFRLAIPSDMGGWSNTDQWYDLINSTSGPLDAWYSVNSNKAKVVDVITDTSNLNVQPMFGGAAVVNNSNIIAQNMGLYLTPGQTYTVSAFFKKHVTKSAGIPMIAIYRKRGDLPRSLLTSKSFARVKTDYTSDRQFITFTVPSDHSIYTDIITIQIQSNDTGWVQVSGVQMVDGVIPTNYEPESSLYNALVGAVVSQNFHARKFTTWGGMTVNSGFINFNSGGDKVVDFLENGQRKGYYGRIISVSGRAGMWINNAVSGKNLMITDNGGLWYTGNGFFDGTVTATGWNTSSRRELKRNILPYEDEALTKIVNTQIYTFNYKDDDTSTKRKIGVMVDEAPFDIVSTDKTGVMLENGLFLTWKAIKELFYQMQEQDHRIAHLEVLNNIKGA